MKERRTCDLKLNVSSLRHRLAKAQKLVRKYVTPTTSLVDELISERRKAARRESNLH